MQTPTLLLGALFLGLTTAFPQGYGGYLPWWPTHTKSSTPTSYPTSFPTLYPTSIVTGTGSSTGTVTIVPIGTGTGGTGTGTVGPTGPVIVPESSTTYSVPTPPTTIYEPPSYTYLA